MKKIIDFTNWKLLFPEFIFESLLPKMNLEDSIIDNRGREMFILVAKGLTFIYLEHLENQKIILKDYSDFLYELTSHQGYSTSEKWTLGISITSFVNFLNVHFSEENTRKLDKIGYELIMGLK